MLRGKSGRPTRRPYPANLTEPDTHENRYPDTKAAQRARTLRARGAWSRPSRLVVEDPRPGERTTLRRLVFLPNRRPRPHPDGPRPRGQTQGAARVAEVVARLAPDIDGLCGLIHTVGREYTTSAPSTLPASSSERGNGRRGVIERAGERVNALLHRWRGPKDPGSLAVLATTTRDGDGRADDGPGVTATLEPDDGDGVRDAKAIRQRADELFRQLPPEIQDPVSRGRENTVIWSSTPDRPSTYDLMRLSDDDLRAYDEVVELTRELSELEADVASNDSDDAS